MALKLGLFLGINHYRRINPENPLRCAVGDAQALAELFGERFGYETQVFTDEGVTSDQLRDTLDDWKHRFENHHGGRLFIYFAGHGATSDDGEPILLTSNARESDISRPMPGGAGVISTRWLEQETAGWVNVKPALVIDACRTRANRRSDLPARAATRDMGANPDLDRTGKADSLVILRSCLPDQVAMELVGYGEHDKSHGIFTAAFLALGERKAKIESPFILGPQLTNDLTTEIRSLARFAPAEYQDQASAQTPMREGAEIELVGTDDYRELTIRRRDRRAIEDARTRGTPDAYRYALMNLSPDSEYRPEANRFLEETESLADEADWEEAQEKARLSAFRRYLSKHPQGRHADEARQEIASQETKVDDQAWAIAKEQGDQAAFALYLKQHPKGRHADEAQQAIASLKTKADDQAWAIAKEQGDQAAFEHYLQQHPEGCHTQEARHELERLKVLQRAAEAAERERQDKQRRDEEQAQQQAEQDAWARTLKDGTEAALSCYLEQFPRGAHWAEAEQRCAAMQLQRENQAEQNRLLAASREQDQLAWQDANAQGTALAYRAYLERFFPDGEQTAKAASRLADEEAWEQAAKTDSEAAYKLYLKPRPHGRHSEQAKKALKRLRDERLALEQRKQEAEDSRLWKQATDTDSVEAYQAYLEATQIKHHEAEARQAIARLQNLNENARKRDKERWELALERHTLKSYEDFLAQEETGTYRNEAAKWLAEFRQAENLHQQDNSHWSKAVNLHTLEAYQDYLRNSPLKTHRVAAWWAIVRLRIPWRAIVLNVIRLVTVGGYSVMLVTVVGFVVEEVRVSHEATQLHQPAPAFPHPEMVRIPAGCFTMGSPPEEEGHSRGEGPQHRVCVSAFDLAKTELTFAQWDACVADGGCNGHKPKDQGWGRGQRPVINVSWTDAQAYVKWLSGKTGQQWRLPSEAEWEYAARAGTTGPFSFSGPITSAKVNYDANYSYAGSPKGEYREKTVPVGSLPANPWGLHEMHGNVWEKVEDCWHYYNYKDAPEDGRAWGSENGGDCGKRAGRGGSWASDPVDVRAAHRIGGVTTGRFRDSGFRPARTVSP